MSSTQVCRRICEIMVCIGKMAVIFEEDNKKLKFFSYLMQGNFGRDKQEYLVAIKIQRKIKGGEKNVDVSPGVTGEHRVNVTSEEKDKGLLTEAYQGCIKC